LHHPASESKSPPSSAATPSSWWPWKRPGVEALAAAVTEDEEAGSAQSNVGGIDHHIVVHPDAAEVELRGTNVVWILDHAKTVELVEKLGVLSGSGRPGRH
jgi:hypothetical protein